MDVSTGCPGRIHDARTFELSDLSLRLPTACGPYYHLVGDSAYKLQENLLTPYSMAKDRTEAEDNYNTRFCRARVIAENAIGRLKSCFRSLELIDMHEVDKMTIFIISCCVLHNLRLEKEFLITRDGPMEDLELLIYAPAKDLEANGKLKRESITQQLMDLGGEYL